MSADKLDEITDRIVAYVASCVEGTSRNPVAFTRDALAEAVAEERKALRELETLVLRWAEEDPDLSGPTDALEAAAVEIRAAMDAREAKP